MQKKFSIVKEVVVAKIVFAVSKNTEHSLFYSFVANCSTVSSVHFSTLFCSLHRRFVLVTQDPFFYFSSRAEILRL